MFQRQTLSGKIFILLLTQYSWYILAYRSKIQRFMEQISTKGEAESAYQQNEAGPIGYIFQRTSGKAIHPYGGSSNPRDDTGLVLYNGAGEWRLQLQFIPQPAYGHFGYIKHVASNKLVHPYGGSAYPGDDMSLVFHKDRHYATLFMFDEEKEQIVHIGGKHWHPYGGSVNPGNNNPVVLYEGSHAATRFYFGDASGNLISPYPKPFLGGDWKLVKAYITPRATHTHTETYRVGRSHSSTATVHRAWSVSVGFAKGLFSAGAEYSGFVERSRDDTWSTEHTEEVSIHVTAGETVVVWQYVYTMEQYNEMLTFRSNILGDTDSMNVKPTLSTLKRQSTHIL